ncbi:hypothetical protein ACLOJK_036547 [Asimina triloba]
MKMQPWILISGRRFGSRPSAVVDVCVELLGCGSAVAVGSWAMVAGANGTPADGAAGRHHRMEGGGRRAGSGWRSVVTSYCRRRMGGRLMMGSDCCRCWRSCLRKGAVDGGGARRLDRAARGRTALLAWAEGAVVGGMVLSACVGRRRRWAMILPFLGL